MRFTDEPFEDDEAAAGGPRCERDERVPDALQALRGRDESRRWIYVNSSYNDELRSGGVQVETCWLPGVGLEAGILTQAGFTRGDDGHYRLAIRTAEYSGLTLGRALSAVARAFCVRRDGRPRSRR